MITFDVDPNLKKFDHYRHYPFTEKELAQYLKQGLGRANIRGEGVEAYAFNSTNYRLLDPAKNGFMETVYNAFNGHQPLTLGPDEVWLVVCQAAAKHVELFPEESRRALVAFEGKQLLTVHANHLVRGSGSEQWLSVFAGFSDKIAEFLGKKRDLFDPTFSTTTWIEKVAIRVQMMAALAPYFDYKTMTLCGIPRVTLLGTVEDWLGIHTRAMAFAEFMPKWAVDGLTYATQQLVMAASGDPDLEFWQNFFKTRGGSGGTPVGGFVNAFFPYMDNGVPNKVLKDGDIRSAVLTKGKDHWDGHLGISNQLGDFGGSVSNVPMLWDYYGEELRMRLATGVFGIAYSEEGGFRPVTGWVIGQDKTPA